MKNLCIIFGLLLLVSIFKDITGRKAKKKKTRILKSALVKTRSFKIDFEKNTFRKDGKPFRFISGDMHYFRITPCSWMDRLIKLTCAGLNTVST